MIADRFRDHRSVGIAPRRLVSSSRVKTPSVAVLLRCYTRQGMKAHTRRAVAYIVVRLVEKKDSDFVYDHDAGKRFSFGGKVSSTAVDVYDYERRCPIGGSLDSLYHYGNRKPFRLAIRGSEFSGYDDDTGKAYSGSVDHGLVNIYDSEVKKDFDYSV